MPSLNKAVIMGHLGQDPEVKYLPNGDAVTNFSVATTEKWKDKTTGEKREKTEWHRIVFYGRHAEICGEYLRKGSLVYIEGRLQTRQWEKDDVTRYTTEIVGSELKLMPRANGDGQGDAQRGGERGKSRPPQQNAPQRPQKPASEYNPPQGGFDDDIPF